MDDEGRVSRGWRLTRTAWSVIGRDRTCLFLTLAQVLASAAVIYVTFGLIAGSPMHRSRWLLAALVAAWPATFLNTFIGVSLCAAASAVMDGGHMSLRDALGVAMRRLGQIVVWSLLATGVGLLLEQLASRIPFGARLLTWLAGVAWSLGTLFVLPILALDGCTADECVRRSSRLIKQRWGEGLTGGLVIGAWTVVLMLPVAIVVGAVAGATRSRGVELPALLAVVVVGSSASWGATRVFSVALYRWATDQPGRGPFTQGDLERPFRPRGWFGR